MRQELGGWFTVGLWMIHPAESQLSLGCLPARPHPSEQAGISADWRQRTGCVGHASTMSSSKMIALYSAQTRQVRSLEPRTAKPTISTPVHSSHPTLKATPASMKPQPSDEASQSLAELERVLQQHQDMEVKNLSRLQTCQHRHTSAVCKAIAALGRAFDDRKLVVLVEAEISELKKCSRPEDIVAWIEGVGVFVVEVKSHRSDGIRSFENNIPQVMLTGEATADKDLLDQPRSFAYDLKGKLEKLFDSEGLELPAVYFAGWLPNVSPEDLLRRQQSVARDKVWLSDMADREVFLQRLPEMRNLTRSNNNSRETLGPFCKIFGSTSGLREVQQNRYTELGSLGHLVDRKNTQLRRLTKEQEDLAFSPLLTRGPKVIRGVAGSGKTIVLANAVAETLLRDMALDDAIARSSDGAAELPAPRILVLCFNRALVPYLRNLIRACFEARKPSASLSFPGEAVKVSNIHRLASKLAPRRGYHINNDAATVASILQNTTDLPVYDYCFIDEGQDINLDWYPLIRALTRDRAEVGRSIVVFYDDAQNLYGIRRPGTAGGPTWESLLGASPNPRSLKTIMRMGHRNTNQVLSFSFAMLLGGYADQDPQMATFADLNDYSKEVIPDDPSIDHPNAGKPCVVKLDQRLYKINFSVAEGAQPQVHCCAKEQQMLDGLLRSISSALDPRGGNVQPSDILVMAPEVQQVHSIAAALEAKGIPVHVLPKYREQDSRDQGCFRDGAVTVSTVKATKGYTAHLCHLVYADSLCIQADELTRRQQARAQFHVACTRSSLFLDVWGLPSPLMDEARRAAEALASLH